jgi:protein involved in polysaccharide export with SLBB domain
MAGGLAQGAQADKVIIRRQPPGSANRSEMAVNLKEINSGKREDVRLQPNDIIEVPGPGKSVFRSIFRVLFPMLTSLPVQVIR